MVTKPFIFEGSRLILNFSSSGAGSIRVEIQNQSGIPTDGYSISECLELFGDDLERPVLWKNGGDVSALSGTPIRLRFVIRDADLYSLRFVE